MTNYIHSKLYPKLKTVHDDITDLVFYIQDIKPYHTKLEDIVVQYTFVENIEATIDENYNSIIDFILDYHEDKDGYDVFRYNHEGYDGNPILVQEYYAKGFNEYAYDCEHYDALLNADYIANNSPTTVKASIKEHLVIDMSRYKMVGLDYKAFDVDNFDTVDISELPEIKNYVQPLYCGDPDINPFTIEWEGFDTSYFIDAFIDPTVEYELFPIMPEFDTDIFHNVVTINLDNVKTFMVINPNLPEFDIGDFNSLIVSE